MKLQQVGILFLFLFCWFTSYSQLTIQLDQLPTNTPSVNEIFISGTFHTWNSADPNYELTKSKDGKFQIHLDIASGLVAFKFTQGSWQSAEDSQSSDYWSNYVVQY